MVFPYVDSVNRKHLGVFAIVAATTIAVITALTWNSTVVLDRTANAATSEQQLAYEGIEHYEDTPEAFLANEGRSAVEMLAQTEEVNAKRGEVVDIPVSFEHHAGLNPYSKLTVKHLETSALIYPPSVAKATTPEERTTMLANGEIPEGAIIVSSLFTLEPGTVDLNAGETKSGVMRITLPKDFPDEMVGNFFYISPEFELLGQGDPAAGDVELYTFGVKVVVS
jgi:hypothetical protein